jgi:hypothetical protein
VVVNALPSTNERNIMSLLLSPLLASTLYIGSGVGLVLVIVVVVLLLRR